MVQTYSTESSVPLPYHVLAPAYFLRYPNPYAQHVLSVDVIERSIVQRPVYNNASSSVSTSSAAAETRPVLLTARVLLKKGTLPKWAPKGLIKNAESYVLEVSEVDLEAGYLPSSNETPASHVSSSSLNLASPFAGMFYRGWGGENSQSSSQHDIPPGSYGRQMRTWTRNLDHTTVLAVAEGLTFTELLDRTSPASESNAKGKGKGKSKDQSSVTDAPRELHCLTSAHITSDVSVLWGRIEKFGLKRFKAHMDTSREGLLWSAASVSNQLYPHDVSPPIQTPITRLRESLRPPWLDGLPLGPIQSLRYKSRQFSQQLKERYRLAREEGIFIGGQHRKNREENMERWRDAFRERLIQVRGRIGGTPDDTQQQESSKESTPIVTRSPKEQIDRLVESDSNTRSLLELPRDRLARLAHEAREERARGSPSDQVAHQGRDAHTTGDSSPNHSSEESHPQSSSWFAWFWRKEE
ncbi:unnamed protein product [Sympodiomycopsis kandeliae]